MAYGAYVCLFHSGKHRLYIQLGGGEQGLAKGHAKLIIINIQSALLHVKYLANK